MLAIHSSHVIHRKPNHRQRNQRKENTLGRNRGTNGTLHRYKIRTRNSNKVGPCDSADPYAPCSCLSFVTQINVDVKKGDHIEQITISFVEHECAKKQKETFKGFKCSQLTDRQAIFRDIYNRPIEIPVAVHYNAGCELRCGTEDCHKIKFSPFSAYNRNSNKMNDTSNLNGQASTKIAIF